MDNEDGVENGRIKVCLICMLAWSIIVALHEIM
jgi:hypothetical protein